MIFILSTIVLIFHLNRYVNNLMQSIMVSHHIYHLNFQYRGVTIDGREVGGKSSSSYELSSFARHGATDPQVGKFTNVFNCVISFFVLLSFIDFYTTRILYQMYQQLIIQVKIMH